MSGGLRVTCRYCMNSEKAVYITEVAENMQNIDILYHAYFVLLIPFGHWQIGRQTV